MDSPLPRSEVPYRRLSLFYFLYFALLGCIAPFWGYSYRHEISMLKISAY